LVQNFPELLLRRYFINEIPSYQSSIFVADDTNNENNASKKINNTYLERNKSGSRRCSSLSIAQSKKFFEGYG
jgi:hypothetical protein